MKIKNLLLSLSLLLSTQLIADYKAQVQNMSQQKLYCPWGGTLSGTTCVSTTVECKTIYGVGSTTTNFQEQVDSYKPLKLFCTNSPIPVLPPQAVSTDISKKTNYDYSTSKNVYGY